MRILLTLLIISLCATIGYAQGVYRLKKGDTIEVAVFQEPNLNRQVIVAPDGRISFPLVGRIRAAGLSIDAVESTLKSRLKKFYQNDLDLTVLLTTVAADKPTNNKPEEDFKPIVYVTGEVQKPGSFEIKYRTSILQAIALSGGLGPYAAKSRIVVRRTLKGREYVFPFDYRAVENGREIVGNINLRHGDVVVVPERGLFE